MKLSIEYVEALNSGGIPQILTSLDRVIQQEARNLLEELKRGYSKMFADGLSKMKAPYDEEEVKNLSKSILNTVLERLEKKSTEFIDAKKMASMKSEIKDMVAQDLQMRIEINKE